MSNTEGRYSFYFKDRLQRFHPFLFCGSLFHLDHFDWQSKHQENRAILGSFMRTRAELFTGIRFTYYVRSNKVNQNLFYILKATRHFGYKLEAK
jgi:hypothetical protein